MTLDKFGRVRHKNAVKPSCLEKLAKQLRGELKNDIEKIQTAFHADFERFSNMYRADIKRFSVKLFHWINTIHSTRPLVRLADAVIDVDADTYINWREVFKEGGQ